MRRLPPVRAVALRRSTPVVATLGLPLLFLFGISITSIVLSPLLTPVATVVCALAMALLLRQALPTMRWPSVTLVTFWFLMAACLAGAVMLLGMKAGLGLLPRFGLGVAAMYAVQALRVWVQFRRR